jgi:transcriptional regulator with XRE-family HTH domain
MGQLWDIVQAHIDSSPYRPSERRVAARIGISPTALSNWRSPKRLPDVENLRALARLTGVPYSEVLEAALTDTGYKEVGHRGDAAPNTPAGDKIAGIDPETVFTSQEASRGADRRPPP